MIDGGVTFGIVGQMDDHLVDADQIEGQRLLHRVRGRLRPATVVDSPFYVSGTDKMTPRMAPGIGQHTEALLKECGLGDAEIAALTADG